MIHIQTMKMSKLSNHSTLMLFPTGCQQEWGILRVRDRTGIWGQRGPGGQQVDGLEGSAFSAYPLKSVLVIGFHKIPQIL